MSAISRRFFPRASFGYYFEISPEIPSEIPGIGPFFSDPFILKIPLRMQPKIPSGIPPKIPPRRPPGVPAKITVGFCFP